MSNQRLHNPHLEGESFLWEGGPTGVLLLHGLTATTAEVRLLARCLHDRGYTVAGPLLPGHGTTPENLNRTRWQEWVQTAEQSYRQLAARSTYVFIGGESMGAVAALYLASEHPEAAGVLAYAPAIKLALRRTDVLRLYAACNFVLSVPKAHLDSDASWQGYPVNPLKAARELLRFERETLRRLPHIRQPMLIVQGRLDTTIDPRCGDIICQAIGSGVKERYWMEQSAHCVILDRELDQVMDITLRFMARCLDGQSSGAPLTPA